MPGDTGQWQPAGWLVEGADQAQALATRLAEAGLEVADAPKYYLQRRRQTDDGEWLQ